MAIRQAFKNNLTLREWKKYVVTLAITLVIFGATIGISMWIDNARVENIRALQDSISLNILSSETQFNLLKNANCEDVFNSDLATQLADMGNRLAFLESTGHSNDTDVISLRQYYYLLEIKDYMLISSATKCPIRPTTVIFFYKPNCAECDKQSDVLTYLRRHYPDNIKIYSFDYSLDVPAVVTLANVNKVENPNPAIVVNGKTYEGFQSIDDVVAIEPKITSNRTRIVLSPHLDDAALSLGGMLTKTTHTPGSPVIATIFTGMPKEATSTSWDLRSGFSDSSEAMNRRLAENSRAADILGSQVVNLGFLDNEYRQSSDSAISTSSLINKISADIIKMIRTYDTSTSSMEIYGPAIFNGSSAGTAGHVDHTILHNAYMNVIAQYRPRGVVTFFIYEDFPYTKNAGIPKTDLTKALRANAPQFSYAPIYIPLTADLVSNKEDSIRAYDSQVKAMNAGIAQGAPDIISTSQNWTKSRCNGLFRVPSACEVVYQVQK